MKFGERARPRNPYSGENPYARLVRSLPHDMVERISGRLASGELAEDVAYSENLILGAVRLIGESVSVVGDTALSPDRLHRIRILLCSEPPQRVAELEGLPLEVVEKIAKRSAAQQARRDRRAEQNTVAPSGG